MDKDNYPHNEKIAIIEIIEIDFREDSIYESGTEEENIETEQWVLERLDVEC